VIECGWIPRRHVVGTGETGLARVLALTESLIEQCAAYDRPTPFLACFAAAWHTV
jgi:hypothetical protein